MSKNNRYAVMTERKTSSDSQTGKPDLEIRILNSKEDLKEIKGNKKLMYEHEVETTKNPQDIAHGFIGYLEKKGMSDYVSDMRLISDDKKNSLVFPNSRYYEIGREITWYLEKLQGEDISE